QRRLVAGLDLGREVLQRGVDLLHLLLPAPLLVRSLALGELGLVLDLVLADDALVVVHGELELRAALPRLARLALAARPARRTAAARLQRLGGLRRVVVGARGRGAHLRLAARRAATLDVAHRQRARLAAVAAVPALALAGLALAPRQHALGLVLLAVV